MLLFCIYSSKNGVPKKLFLMSATANGIMNQRELSSIVVFNVRVTYCNLGTCVQLATVSFLEEFKLVFLLDIIRSVALVI